MDAQDIASYFSAWNEAPPPAFSSASVQGTLCSVSSNKGSNVSCRVYVDAADNEDPLVGRALEEGRFGMLYVSVPRQQLVNANVEPMDVISLDGCTETVSSKDGRRFLNAECVRRIIPWTQTVTKEVLAENHLLMPEDETLRYGPACLIYSGTPSEPVSYAVAPGLHRRGTWDTMELAWTRKGAKSEERRLCVTFVQRQWDTLDELPEAVPVAAKMFLWDDQCRQLPGDGLVRDLAAWKALMMVHHIPFYALVRLDKTYSDDKGASLSTLAVQWDVASYLTDKSSLCVSLPLDSVQALVKGATTTTVDDDEAKEGDIVNVTSSKNIPAGTGWKYFALTSQPKRFNSADKIVAASGTLQALVILAMWNRKSSKLKRRKVDA